MAKGIEQGYRLVLTAIAQRQDARRAVARLKIGSFNYFFFSALIKRIVLIVSAH
jgi:hypothetical protein